jgi:hypothetical protein
MKKTVSKFAFSSATLVPLHFGGFLLRRAFELAFATTYVFGGARPVFKQVSGGAPVQVVNAVDP